VKPIRNLLFALPLASALVFAQDANAQKQADSQDRTEKSESKSRTDRSTSQATTDAGKTSSQSDRSARSDSEQNKSQSQTSTQTTERDRPLTKEQNSTQTSDRDRTRTESETASQTSDKDRTRTESQSQAQPPASQPEDSSKGTASRTETSSNSNQNWKGTLVDANCNAVGTGGSNAIKSSTGTEPNTSADRHQNTANTGETVPGQTPEHTATGMPRGGKDFAKKCPVNSSTSAFAIVTSEGQFYKFDESGNSKVTAMLGGGSSDSNNRNFKKGKNKQVSVSGSLQGDTIKVESVM